MSTVIDELSQWGPQVSIAAPTLAEAQHYCRRLARTHYENFPVASLLLPRSLRQHFANVYAYCRWADDLGDETGDSGRSLELLAWWRAQLERCYAGEAVHPVFVALRQTIDEFAIPQQPFADLISAFEQDQHVRRYETFEQLHDYCRRSADPVGRIVLHLCRNTSDQTFAWSDSVCTGLQLANFWQDVARDYDIGRVYLPRSERERFGYSEEDLEQRRTTPHFRELMQFQVQRAREFLLDGSPLIPTMPGRLQVDIDMFVRGGLQILRKIEAIDYDVWRTRPVVSKWTFAALSVRSLAATAMRSVRG